MIEDFKVSIEVKAKKRRRQSSRCSTESTSRARDVSKYRVNERQKVISY